MSRKAFCSSIYLPAKVYRRYAEAAQREQETHLEFTQRLIAYGWEVYCDDLIERLKETK